MGNVFVERLQAHLDSLNQGATIRRDRVTAYKVALEVGLDPTYVTNIFRGRKNGTPETIKQLSRSRLLKLTYERLRSWQALNELEPEVLKTCIQEMDPIATGTGSTLDATMRKGYQTIAFRWQINAGGITELPATSDGFQWMVPDIPQDVLPQLGSVQVLSPLLWPPIPAGSVLLLRPTRPPHLLHADRWYVVQLHHNLYGCLVVKFDPALGLLYPLNPSIPPIALTMDTLLKAFEIVQYQVNLSGI